MTNKKIDIYFRFLLYFLPLGIAIGYFVILKGTGGNIQPSNILSNVYNLLIGIGNVTGVDRFFTWFKTNVIDTQITNFSFLYCFYIVYVEICILMKNVLVFIIHVANNFIERGAEIGK